MAGKVAGLAGGCKGRMVGIGIDASVARTLIGIVSPEFTALEYGEGAADAYVTELNAVMLGALEYPLMGADCSEVRKGYRRIRAGGHMIYYIPHQRGIDVMRVMHPRQHAREHLKG